MDDVLRRKCKRPNEKTELEETTELKGCENERTKRRIYIAIATNSGKTLLARQLCEALPKCHSFCQDTYFHLPGHPDLVWVPEVQHQNWEQLSALDMGKLVSDLQEKINKYQAVKGEGQPVVLLVEGFRLYGYKPLLHFFDKKYFLTMTKSACEDRRSKRVYTPPDPPGYFEKVVWPEHEIHRLELEGQNDIEYLDGTGNQEEIFQKVLQEIQQT